MGSVDFVSRMSVRPGDAPIWTHVTNYLRRMDRDVNKHLRRSNVTRSRKTLQVHLIYTYREDVEAVPMLLERGTAHLRYITYILVFTYFTSTFVFLIFQRPLTLRLKWSCSDHKEYCKLLLGSLHSEGTYTVYCINSQRQHSSITSR